MYTKFKFIFLALSVCLCTHYIYAQAPAIAPGGDSRGVVDRVQNSVDYHTGTVNISVPLYSVNHKGISIPIGLSYRTSGIKIDDRGGSVGLGWNLIAGGRITRIVKQKPDIENSRMDDPTSSFGSAYAIYNKFFRDPRDGYKEYGEYNSEPDQFFFEFPGYSGMFVLDKYNNVHTIPAQPNLNIRLVDGAFMIKDEKGNQYSFAIKELNGVLYTNNNADAGQTSYDFFSTWYLSYIKAYTGERVDLSN